MVEPADETPTGTPSGTPPTLRERGRAGDPGSEPAPRADWSRAAEGIQLAGIGFFLFLNTTGAVPWSFWMDALVLWPLLLVAAGLRMVVDRSRAPWLALIGPAIVLGALSWVAMGARIDAAPAEWTPRSAARPPGVERLTLDSHLVGARLDLTARPVADGLLAEGRSAVQGEPAAMRVNRDGTTANLRLVSVPFGGFPVRPGGRDRWDLSVTDTLPVSLILNGAMLRGTIDLTRSQLEAGDLKGAFYALRLRLPRPGEPTTIRIRGAFNVLQLSIPPGTPVRLRSDNPFNILRRGEGVTRPDDGAKAPGYDIRIDGAFNSVSVETAASAEDSGPPRPRPEAPPR